MTSSSDEVEAASMSAQRPPFQDVFKVCSCFAPNIAYTGPEFREVSVARVA
jgi:hypothetical protein